MTAKTARKFGLFESPLSPGSLAEDKRLDAVRWDSDGRTLVWLEGRSGKGVLVVEANGLDAPRDLTAEVIAMRAEDIDRSREIWIYGPPDHKNQWRGDKRRIPLGPKAQEILTP